jgi:hypothetical protein
MAKVVAIHRLQLHPGVVAAAFEQFVQSELFPGLNAVFAHNKMITHNATKIAWLQSDHLLLRMPGSDPSTYLWMIVAPINGELSNDERLREVEREASDIAEQFFDRRTVAEDIAAKMLKPFATRISLETFIEAAAWRRTT